jgi:hypothetical protein
MCNRTLAWRATPDDRTCEHQVNELCRHLPLCLNKGRIQDETDPQLGMDDLQETYRRFLQYQFGVVSRQFGHTNARESYEQTLNQLAPELQDAARRYGFHQVTKN